MGQRSVLVASMNGPIRSLAAAAVLSLLAGCAHRPVPSIDPYAGEPAVTVTARGYGAEGMETSIVPVYPTHPVPTGESRDADRPGKSKHPAD